MLEYKKGDIFESDTEALVNPVNTNGIMGKGLAYQFKKKFPNNFKLYSEKCLDGSFNIGSPLLWINENNKIVINFPTKKNWKENSKIEYIQVGLEKLAKLLVELNLDSVAIPPIGAGNGKLDWDLVLSEIKKFNDKISDNVKIFVYVPTSDVFKLSKGHYLLVYALLEMYKQGLTKGEINDLSFQKILFLGDRNNYFKFTKNKKGPFSKLLTLQYNEIKEYSRIRKMNLNEIKEEMLKLNVSKSQEKEEKEINEGIKIYKKMKEYFSIVESEIATNKIELLGTILYLIKNDLKEGFSLEILYNEVINWNDRKKKLYNKEDIEEMLNFLLDIEMINIDIFGMYKLNKLN